MASTPIPTYPNTLVSGLLSKAWDVQQIYEEIRNKDSQVYQQLTGLLLITKAGHLKSRSPTKPQGENSCPKDYKLVTKQFYSDPIMESLRF